MTYQQQILTICRLMKNLKFEETTTGWSVSLTSVCEWLAHVAKWRKQRHGIDWDGYIDLKLTLDGRVVANNKPEVAFEVVW